MKLKLTHSQISEAREWLLDCVFADVDSADIEAMPDYMIEQAVARHFDGGISAFLATCFQPV